MLRKHFVICILHILFQLHSMILILYQHHILYAALLCDSRTKPILTHTPEDPFLEIDVKGGERDHIKAYHFQREREIITSTGGERDLQGGEYSRREQFSRIPDAWCSRGEMPHVFLRGKTCSYVLICISSDFAFCSVFLFPIFSQYPMLDSGGARHLRERNHLNSLHIFTLGDMSNPMWYFVLTLHVIPVLVFLWFLLFALVSGCTCVS